MATSSMTTLGIGRWVTGFYERERSGDVLVAWMGPGRVGGLEFGLDLRTGDIIAIDVLVSMAGYPTDCQLKIGKVSVRPFRAAKTPTGTTLFFRIPALSAPVRKVDFLAPGDAVLESSGIRALNLLIGVPVLSRASDRVAESLVTSDLASRLMSLNLDESGAAESEMFRQAAESATAPPPKIEERVKVYSDRNQAGYSQLHLTVEYIQVGEDMWDTFGFKIHLIDDVPSIEFRLSDSAVDLELPPEIVESDAWGDFARLEVGTPATTGLDQVPETVRQATHILAVRANEELRRGTLEGISREDCIFWSERLTALTDTLRGASDRMSVPQTAEL